MSLYLLCHTYRIQTETSIVHTSWPNHKMVQYSASPLWLVFLHLRHSTMEIYVDQILRNGATVSSGIYILVTSPWQTTIPSASLNIEFAVLDCIIDLYCVARHVLLCSPHPYLLQVPPKQATFRRKEQAKFNVHRTSPRLLFALVYFQWRTR